MFIVRDIFQLKFGHYKDAKILLDEAANKNILPQQQGDRILSDFTGDAYRLIFEQGFESLDEFEKSLSESISQNQWQQWFERFKPHVERSHREILKLII